MTSSLKLQDGTLAYEATGPEDGPLVVCVHGLGDNRATFRLLAPILAGAGHRVVSVDVRGYGESSAEWAAGYEHPAVGRDLLALIDHLGTRPATIVGSSIGCAAAVWAAAEAPSKVESLVLIGTFSGDSTVKGWMRAAARLVGSSPTLWGWYYGSLFKAGRPADFSVQRKALVASLRRPGRMTALRAQVQESLSGVQSRYGEVTCPTLIITGSKDPDMPDPAAEATASAAKIQAAKEIFMVDGAGHYPHLEVPEAIAQAILAWHARV